MMLLPEVQRKVQSEIDEVVGRERLPSLTDRSSMPYTEAVIQELTRIQPIGPLGGPHRATEEFILKDFTIPKDTVIMGNIYAVHRDPGIFENPSEFRPERLLSEDGTKVLKSDFLIPFGVGRFFYCQHQTKKWVFMICFENQVVCKHHESKLTDLQKFQTITNVNIRFGVKWMHVCANVYIHLNACMCMYVC